MKTITVVFAALATASLILNWLQYQVHKEQDERLNRLFRELEERER